MIVGTATFRIVLSSTMMNSVLDRITKAIQRSGSGGPAGAPQPPPPPSAGTGAACEPGVGAGVSQLDED